MADKYIKIFYDFIESTAALSDEEIGRLIIGMLSYAKDGDIPCFAGNESFLFPVFKAQIDRDRDTYVEKSKSLSENGKKGGRPKKTTDNDESKCFTEKAKKAKAFSKSKKSQEEEKEEEKDKEKDKDKESIYVSQSETHAPARKKFIAPSVEDVEEYCKVRGNSVDAKRFIDYYTSNGWKVGKNPMKDWKAAVRNWERSDRATAAVEDGCEGATTRTGSFETDDFFEAALRRSYENDN